jgi:hypothetical protein
MAKIRRKKLILNEAGPNQGITSNGQTSQEKKRTWQDITVLAEKTYDLADIAAVALQIKAKSQEEIRKIYSVGMEDYIPKIPLEKLRVPVNIENVDPETGQKTVTTMIPAQVIQWCNHAKELAMNQPKEVGVLFRYFYKPLIWTFDKSIPSAASDGIRIAFNPVFANELLELGGAELQTKMAEMRANRQKPYSEDERVLIASKYFLFVIIHEAYHQIYRHREQEQRKPETENGKNHDLANIAEDVEINRDIEKQILNATWGSMVGFTKATGGVYDDRFPSEAWDAIFDAYYNGKYDLPEQPFQRQKSNGPTLPRLKNMQNQQGGEGSDGEPSDSGDSNGDNQNSQNQQGGQQGNQQSGQQGNQQNQQGGQQDGQRGDSQDGDSGENDGQDGMQGGQRGQRGQQGGEFGDEDFDDGEFGDNSDGSSRQQSNKNGQRGSQSGNDEFGDEDFDDEFGGDDSFDDDENFDLDDANNGSGGQNGQRQRNQQAGQQAGQQGGQQGGMDNNSMNNGQNSQGQSGNSQNGQGQNSQGQRSRQQSSGGSVSGGASAGGDMDYGDMDMNSPLGTDLSDKSDDYRDAYGDELQKQLNRKLGKSDGSDESSDNGNETAEQQAAREQAREDIDNAMKQWEKEIEEQSKQGNSMEDLQKQYEGATFETSASKKFGGCDMVSQSDLAKIAEEAGQNYDAEDLSASPIERARTYTEKNRDALSENKDLKAKIDNVFDKLHILQPLGNWKSTMKKFFKLACEGDIEHKFSKRAMSQKHRFDRYGLYKEVVNIKPEGAQIFYLIDGSGSMWWAGGEDIFLRIFKEILELERTCKVQLSARAYFATGGKLTDDDIFMWDAKTNRDTVLQNLGNTGSCMGTEISRNIVSVTQLGKPYYYNKRSKHTTIMCFTDGEECGDFSILNEIPLKDKKDVVFVLLNKRHMLPRIIDQITNTGNINITNIIAIATEDYS